MTESPKWTDVAIVILTIGIVFFALMQWLEMQGAGRQTDKLVNYARAQADAASDQADAAQQFSDTAEDINGGMSDAVAQLRAAADNTKSSIRATQDALRLEQRAWVGLSVADLPRPLPVGAPFEVVNHFSNTGKSPALRVHAVSEIEMAAPRTAPIYKETDAPEGPPLLPGAEVRGTANISALTQDEITLVKSGALVIYDRGAVWYWDVFGRKHVTTFCLSYNPSSGAFHADATIPCAKQEVN